MCPAWLNFFLVAIMPLAVLGIETSGLTGGIALRVDGEPVEERELERAGRRHAQTLILQVHELLTAHGLRPGDMDVCGVSQGPGSFTGLRVGIVFAKTLAWSTGCRLISVDTFEAIASASGDDVSRVSVVSDAQREQLFEAEYVRDDSGIWKQQASIQIIDASEWLAGEGDRRASGCLATGPGLSRLDESELSSIATTDETVWNPRSSIVAAISERRATVEAGADPATLEPFYLRRSAAEEKRDAVVKKSGR